MLFHEKYQKLKEQSAVEEAALHMTLDPNVEAVVSSKAILLFRRMPQDIGFDDMAVVDLHTHGVRIVGDLETLGFWKSDDRRLRALAVGAQDEVFKVTNLSPDHPVYSNFRFISSNSAGSISNSISLFSLKVLTVIDSYWKVSAISHQIWMLKLPNLTGQ